MRQKFKYYWEDFSVGVVREFGQRKITEQEIVEFAREYDPQRFHISQDEAEQTIFKGLIASGWQTCSIMMRMMCDDFLLDSSSMGSPGLENLKWHKPVRPNDVLSLRTEVLEARAMKSKPDTGLVHLLWQCKNQEDEVVTSMQGWMMFLKRDSQPSS